jgi:subtilisin family serine protease
VLVTSVIVQQVLAEPAAASVAAPAPEAMTADQVNDMFRTYGDEGDHWTGGDSTVSAVLPDGRVVWLFSDTFLGTVNPDGSRPKNTPMVNNTLVVQDGAALVDTRHGGSAEWPASLVTPEQPGEFFWVADAVVESGALKVLYNRYARYGDGGLDVELRGTSLVTFALPDLTVGSVVDLPLGSAVTWGSALMVDGGYTYVYGSSAAPGAFRFAHVARVPVGDLGAAWQFWTGSAWSSSEAAAGRLFSGVGTAYAVQKVGAEYVLVTQEANLVFDPQFVAYRSGSPTGPFTGPTYLLTAPEQRPGNGRIVYAARLHPELAPTGRLLMSYDVNSLEQDDVFADARLYRPRFVEIDWPRPAPGPVPAAPGGFTATGDSSGVVQLRWNAVSGATGYRVWRRDVTAGQTSFVRQPWPVTGTSADVTGLITGHRYEFKVTATNDAGEGAFTPTIAVTSRIVRNASIIKLSDTSNAIAGSYLVQLKDTPHIRGAGVTAYARDLITQAGGTLGPILEPAHGFAARLSEAQAIDLAGHPDVLLVEQDQVVRLDPFEVEPVSTRGEQRDPPSWGLDRIDERALKLDSYYGFPNTGQGVDVYVVDTGIATGHPSFEGRAVWGTNTTNDGRDEDCVSSGHGTHVAGTAGSGRFGVAKNVRLIAIKVFDCRAQGTSVTVNEGLKWAIAQAKAKPAGTRSIINLSLTVGAPSQLVNSTIRAAVDANIVVVAAAGNEDRDVGNVSPAASPHVITVGATNRTDKRGFPWSNSGGSNFGTALDLFAPGEAITSAAHNDFANSRVLTGTSMAAPHVSGAAAMVLEAHPTYSPAQVERVLVEEATRDVVTEKGTGSPNRLLFVGERPPAQAPTDLAATAKQDGTVDLSWAPVAGQGMHYIVWQRDVTAGDEVFTRWQTPVFGATTAVAGNLEGGHTYEFKVAAANLAGVGPQSAPARATAPSAAPTAPRNLTATANTNGTVTLQWQAPAPDVWYWVYQRDLSVEGSTFVRLPWPVTQCCTMTPGLLQHDHEYEYEVSAVNGTGGEGPRSNPAAAVAKHPAPTPPSNLVAIAGNGEVKLTWKASLSPNVWYWVYQRNRSADEDSWTRLPIPLPTCCTMTAGYLANGDEYEFRVTAVGAGPESGPSNIVRATPRRPIPGQVTGLTATANADGTVRLDWTEPPLHGPFYFEVFQRDVTANGGWVKLPLPVECCTMTAGLLEHNHTYEFKVVATNGRPGPESAAVRIVARQALPTAPTDLRGRTSGDGHIQLTWSPPRAGGFYYWVYSRNVSAGETRFTKASLPTDKTFVSIGPLRHNDRYEFKVTAANLAGEGPASAPVQVVSLGGLPAPPTGLSAARGDGKVTLSWARSPTPNVWYWIEWRAAGGPWEERKLDSTCCSYQISFLANGTTYEFRVRATNASGDSAPTGIVSARPLPPVPTAPTNLTATAGDGTVRLAWAASTPPNVFYWIEYRANNGGWRRIGLPVGTCCAHTVSLLFNGTTYDFRLVAANLAGESAPSNVARARPLPALPRPPVNLRAYAGTGHVTLKWDAGSSDPVYYWIEYRRAGGAWQRLAYPFGGCCAFKVSYLQNGVAYDFRVKASNLAGDSGWSNVASATPTPPRGSCWLAALPPAGSPPGLSRVWVPRGAYSCTAVMHNVSVTVYLWTNYYGIWHRDTVSTRRSWGTINVNDIRSGFIDAWILAPEGGCFPHHSQVVAQWTDIDGKRQRRSETSRIVRLNDAGDPC